MTLISALFLIFIFSIQTIEATGPKDLNPEKTKAEVNLSQSSAANPSIRKKLSLKEKKALLKDIIFEDASSSAYLKDLEIQAIKSELGISESNFIPKVLKITIQDDELQAAGSLKDFIESPNKIAAFLNEAEFIEKIMYEIKKEHRLKGEYSYSLSMGDAGSGTFEIYFYKTEKDLVKDIILEDVSCSEDLSDANKTFIQDQSEFKDIWIREGFKVIVEDDQLQVNGLLKDFIESPNKIAAFLNKAEFIEKIMEAIKKEHKLTGEYSYSLNKGKANTGAFEIYFYKNAAKSLKSKIIRGLANCRHLDNSEIADLKADSKIYDRKYISQACEILIEDRNLANLIGENKVESFKDIDYRQEIADGLNKANLNLDKHMSVYFKVQDMTKGRIGVILADTRSQKEPELIEALKNFNTPSENRNKKEIEEAYGVQYINLAMDLHWKDDRFQSGGEFDKSFGLIDEILKTNTEIRTAWIDRANEKRRSDSAFEEAIPNDSNTIIRSRLSSGKGYISIFTLSESPKESIQSHLLDWIDFRIKSIKSYSAIKYKKSINDFEEERILKQGLKVGRINDERLLYGGSLSDYANSEAMNKLLDDADFKRKVITKINDYQTKDEKLKKELKFPFSTDNLENIKIKAQGFSTGYYFQLDIYELYP